MVVDNGTYGYKVGESMSKDGGTYTIYGSSPTAAGNYQAGYNYMTEYVAGGQTYTPSDRSQARRATANRQAMAVLDRKNPMYRRAAHTTRSAPRRWLRRAHQ